MEREAKFCFPLGPVLLWALFFVEREWFFSTITSEVYQIQPEGRTPGYLKGGANPC
jgi:hypothetical protein